MPFTARRRIRVRVERIDHVSDEIKQLRIVIDAQLPPGGLAGGVQQFTTSLIQALGQLGNGSEEYLIVSHWKHPNWLEPYLGSNQRIVIGRQPQTPRDPFEAAKRLLGPMRVPARKLWRGARRFFAGSPDAVRHRVPTSNGFYESLGAHVIHFPTQGFVRCSVPSIYNPHDLQHLHYPQFWNRETTDWRETIYPAGCRQSGAVVVESRWVKDDLIRQYGIDPEKIYVIYMGSPTEMYEPITDQDVLYARQRFQLPDTFVLYPAQTWAHKNHIRLLEAIRLLRDHHGVTINLVCTGRQNDFWPTIKRYLHEVRLENQVFFLGFVHPAELRALYRLAQFLVFPSLFEGGGFPVVEAFSEGTPVACSAVTSLHEYGGDAVLPFDSASVESIAQAVFCMATDSELRATLRTRGAVRAGIFSGERTAKTYRALYRKLAGHPLADQDQRLLASAGELVGTTPSIRSIPSVE